MGRSDAVRTLDDFKRTEASSCEDKTGNQSVDRQAAAVHRQQDPGPVQLVVLFLAAFVFHLPLFFHFFCFVFFSFIVRFLQTKKTKTKHQQQKRDNPFVSIWDTSLHLLRNWPPGACRKRM